MRILRLIVGLAVVVLTLGALAGFWAYFEYLAPIVPSTILDKQQRIVGGLHAGPGRYLSASFTLKDETEETRYLYGSPTVTDVNVDAATYAAHDVGASVSVKYLPFNPRMARLEGQPLVPRPFVLILGAILVTLATLLLFRRTRGGVALCALLIAALVVSMPGPPPAQPILAASVIAAVIAAAFSIVRRGSPVAIFLAWLIATAAVVGWPMVQGARAATAMTTAQVRDVYLFQLPRTMTRTRPRFQEFDRVLASFVPDGGTEPLFVVDYVDHDTVADVKEGSRVTVQYRTDDPQQARLSLGGRSHYWKNGVLPVGVVLIAVWLTTRKTRAQKAAPRTQKPA